MAVPAVPAHGTHITLIFCKLLSCNLTGIPDNSSFLDGFFRSIGYHEVIYKYSRKYLAAVMKPDFRQFSIWQNNSTNFAFYRAYIKISISEGKQIICNVFARTLRNVAICEMSEFYTQTWATLVCDHKLCEECFNSCIDYICPKDHRRTTKDQAIRGECTSELQFTIFYCPGCGCQKWLENIVGHIRSEHPELLENVDEPLRQCQREVNAFTGTDPCKNDGRTRQHGGEQLQEMAPSARHANLDAQGDTEMIADDDSSDSLPGALDNAKLDHEIGTCRHCNTPLEKKDIEEHEAKCLDLCVECPNCKEKISAKNFVLHTRTLCPARERKTADKLSLQIRVELENGYQVPCKLDAGSAINLVQCANCGFYALKWTRLRCNDSLCEECFMKCKEYFCSFHKVMTTNLQARSGRCEYAVLKDVLIECIYCSEWQDANTIANHIQKEHRSFFVEGSSRKPNAVQNQTELCNSKVLDGHMLPSSNGRTTELLKPRQPMAPQRVGDTKTEPEKTSRDRIMQCENYKRAAPVTDFESQCSELCEAEHRNESVANLGVKQEEDDRSEDKKLDDDIQEVKAAIRVLEQRLEKIEKPLRKIIARLSKN
ncbi:uncharacterized protein LOC119463883 isoform X3 [Dermacentor silvarum]|uniref:uncharacterized protein LOC119463883 isoform X3 n=1 Tax=Dermacentor silvarum TaxID=543639 RepID=UPI002101A379|nr:uncharacterized protein LOC119463883 isoform X3 [Dermacentor silvarum]